MPAWIEIARTGTFADSMGRPQTFTARDLEAIAGAYDPHKRDAPLVFGHPESDAAPAFGWVERLKSEGGKLLATFADVPQEVRELVAKGHYRHVSMSLMPDRTTLRHVALLGAAQPAIDGLKAVSFAADEGAITIEFAAAGGEGDTAMTIEELQRQVGQLQAQLESLTTENKSLKKQLSETEDRYKRVLAEYQNFRTRTQRERESLYLDSVASTVEAFLPVMDTLERAVAQETDEGFKDSLGRIVKQYSDCLERFNIKPFGQIGEVFNPKFHNAVMQSDEEGLEPNTIAEVFSKGYAMGDRIIRYAMVKVAN